MKKKKQDPEVQEVPPEVAESAGELANGPPPKEDKKEKEFAFKKAEWEHYQAIREAHERVHEAQQKYDTRKGQAKAAKEQLELAYTELSNLIAEGPKRPDPQKKLSFDEGGTADQKETHHDNDATQAKIDATDWERTPIIEILTLTEKQREKLEEAGIWTIGQFENVRGGRNRDYPRGLRSIRGVGEKTVDTWEDDVVNWLSKNARQKEEPEQTEAKPEGGKGKKKSKKGIRGNV